MYWHGLALSWTSMDMYGLSWISKNSNALAWVGTATDEHGLSRIIVDQHYCGLACIIVD